MVAGGKHREEEMAQDMAKKDRAVDEAVNRCKELQHSFNRGHRTEIEVESAKLERDLAEAADENVGRREATMLFKDTSSAELLEASGEHRDKVATVLHQCSRRERT